VGNDKAKETIEKKKMKVEASGFIRTGKLFITERQSMNDRISFIKDCPVTITIEDEKSHKTLKQGGYYWSALVPHTLIILRDICGYSEYKTKEDAHEFLKYRHNPLYKPGVGGEQIRYGGSTRKMTKEEKTRYIDDIIVDGWVTFNYTYPPPKKGQDKYTID
jgi:hypothetical protein